MTLEVFLMFIMEATIRIKAKRYNKKVLKIL
jgi:hypothetical protein